MDYRKKYQIQDKDPYPHMGKMLKKYLKTNNILQATVAHKIDIAPNGMVSYFEQESLQAGLLWKISTALNHNILADIAAMHPLSKNAIPQPTPRELELEEQVKVLQIELEVYKRITGK
ncbi:MAG: hypothetical protein EOO43_07715 [Flavobacterium sp.]|nr:MAG: hypothetical protein EOO43_07715 [Flavobacterium sp.]